MRKCNAANANAAKSTIDNIGRHSRPRQSRLYNLQGEWRNERNQVGRNGHPCFENGHGHIQPKHLQAGQGCYF